MLESLAFAALVYSAYLTLYDYLVAIYLVGLLVSVVFGFYRMFFLDILPFWLFMLNLSTYTLVSYCVGTKYWVFEKDGGNRHQSWNALENMEEYLAYHAHQPLLIQADEESTSILLSGKKKLKKKKKRVRISEYISDMSTTIGDSNTDSLVPIVLGESSIMDRL